MSRSLAVLLKSACSYALLAALCCPSASALAQEAITTPILTSAPNFRDLAGISASNGGTGYVNTTSNDGVMRTGVFYRSDVLSLNYADWTTISSFGIGRDIDLRTPDEIAATPDVVPYGALYTNINIYGTQNTSPNPALNSPVNVAVQHMESGYEDFVTNAVDRYGFYQVLTTLAADRKADLYHCAGGKDRTGWTSVLLESIAGVSDATIMQDYLATNLYTSAIMSSSLAEIMAANPGANEDTVRALLGVQASYLEAGLTAVMSTYGSMKAYLMQGIGLSQADIYVLRGKMVYYRSVPGESGFVGNAASGASFLKALQNSSLSGDYTAYNYYFQSAIDAGTLGGVETRVGGQVHADAASFLLRQPQWLDEAVMPYANSRDLTQEKPLIWMAALGGGFWSQGHDGVASSAEHSAGSVVGVTYRLNDKASATFGVGYNEGEVGSVGANANVKNVLGTLGGRYALTSLDNGPFMAARGDLSWVDYDSKRALGNGLGTAHGSTNGGIYSGLIGPGDVVRFAPFTMTLQTGLRVSEVSLAGFSESGSDLALDVKGIQKTSTSALVDLDIDLDRQQVGSWSLAPAVALGYERALDHPDVRSTGWIEGFSVSQDSAYDSHDLMKAGLNVTARHEALTVKAGGNALIGGASKSTGISGQVSVGYSF